MRKLLLLLLAVPVFVFFPAFAAPSPVAPVSLDFSGVSLVTVGQAVFRSLLDRDFVVAPDVVAMDRKISMHVKSLPVDELPAFIENILLDHGIVTTLRNGVYYLSSKNVGGVVLPSVSGLSSTGDVAAVAPTSFAAVAPASGRTMFPRAAVAGDAVSGERHPDDISEVYPLRHRPPEFISAVVNSAFGLRASVVAGPDLVITGSKELVQKIRKLIVSLDVAPRTIEISASFVEVSRSAGAARGVSLVVSVLGAKLRGAIGGPGASAVSLGAANFALVLDALENDGRFKQVSNSKVVGDELEKLVLSVGDETPTIGSTSRDQQGNAIQNVVYRPSGVILDVVSRVSGSGVLSLLVDGQISSFVATQTGVSSSPTLIKRQVKTRVSVADGEVLVIGGLDDTKSSRGSSGLSFLPRSWAMGSSSDSHTDLVLILSARVLKRDEVGGGAVDAPAGS